MWYTSRKKRADSYKRQLRHAQLLVPAHHAMRTFLFFNQCRLMQCNVLHEITTSLAVLWSRHNLAFLLALVSSLPIRPTCWSNARMFHLLSIQGLSTYRTKGDDKGTHSPTP